MAANQLIDNKSKEILDLLFGAPDEDEEVEQDTPAGVQLDTLDLDPKSSAVIDDLFGKPEPLSDDITKEPKQQPQMGFGRYLEAGVERQARLGKDIEKSGPAGQMLLGFIEAAGAGTPTLLYPQEFLEDTRPKDVVEKLSRYAGHFAGFVAGAPMAVGKGTVITALKAIGKSSVVEGRRKVVSFLTKIFGEKVGEAVFEGLPLAVASAVTLDERTRNNLARWKEQGLIDEVNNRLEALAWGQLIGTQFGWVARTFDRFTVRAAVNVTLTQLSSVVSAALQGRSDVIPPIEDILYQTLLDVYFSKNRTLTERQIQEIEARRKDIKEFVSWLSKALELDKFAKDVERATKDPVKLGTELKAPVVEGPGSREKPRPIIYITGEELLATFGKKPTEPTVVGKSVKYSPGYDNFITQIKKLRSDLVNAKQPKRKKIKADIEALEYMVRMVEERAAIGQDEADVWWRYWDQLRKSQPKADSRLHVFVIETIRAALDNAGLSAHTFLERAKDKVFFTKLPPEHPKAKKVQAVYALGERRIKFTPWSKFPQVAVHEVGHAVDHLFRDLGINLTKVVSERLKKSGIKPASSKLSEAITEAFEAYMYKIGYRDDKFIRRAFRVYRELAQQSFEEALQRLKFHFYDPNVLSELRSVVDLTLGPHVANRVWNKVVSQQKLYGQRRQELDPDVYALRLKGPQESRAMKLMGDIARRARVMRDIQAATFKVGGATRRLSKRYFDMLALQWRDINALSNILGTPVLFDGAKARVLFPTDLSRYALSDMNKLTKVQGDLSLAQQSVLDFMRTVLRPDAKVEDVLSSFNNILASVATYKGPARDDALALRAISRLETPLLSVNLAKEVSKTLYYGGEVTDLLSAFAKGVEQEAKLLKSRTYSGITSEVVRFWLDNFSEPRSDAKLVERVPDPNDILWVAEWITTPEYALRNFPEAQRELVKLIEAHLVHFRTVEQDKAFFRDALSGVSKSQYPVLREAINNAYKLKEGELRSKYGDTIAEAAIKLKDWFSKVRDEIKSHMKELEAASLSPIARDVANKLSDVTDKKEFARRVVDELQKESAKFAVDYWNTYLVDNPVKKATNKSEAGKFLSNVIDTVGKAYVEATKGEQARLDVIKEAVESIRKISRSDNWRLRLTNEELTAAKELAVIISRLPTVSRLTTKLRTLLKYVIRRNSGRVLSTSQEILDNWNKYSTAKLRRITIKGRMLRTARELVEYWNRLVDIDKWGVWDYVTRIELGTYKVVDENSHIVLIRPTEKQAREAIEEYRRIGIIGRDEPVKIVNEYSKVDPMAPRKLEGLKGDPDLLKALDAYSYYVRKNLIVIPAINEVSRNIRTVDVNLFPPNVRRVINGVIRSLRGRYYLSDQLVDRLSSYLGGEMFKFSKAVNFARTLTASAKLGWRVGAFLVNSVFGYGHTWTKVPTRYFINAFKWMRTDEGRRFLEQEEKYIGIGFVEAESVTIRQFMKKVHPLWLYSSAEFGIRRHSLAANYLYAKEQLKLKEPDAREFARKGVRVQQFLYTIHALPRLFRGPVGRLTLQFRSYMVQEMQFLTTLTPTEWVKYLTLQLAFGGPQAMLHLMHSLPFIDAFGLLDKVERGLQSLRFPKEWPIVGGKPVAFGLFGLLGFDISMAAAIQLPDRLEEWFGAFIADAIKVYRSVRDSINYGVRYGIESGKITDTVTGVRWLLDRVGQAVVISRYLGDALQAFTTVSEGDLWFRKDGRKVFPLRSYYDVALLALGLKPVAYSQYQSLYNTWLREQFRKERKRQKIVDQAVWYLSKGQELPDWLIEDMLLYGVTPEGIKNAWRSAELDPQTRALMISRYVDRISTQERMFLRDLWESYLEAQR